MHAKESQVAKPKQNKTKRKQERFENRFLQKMDAKIEFKKKLRWTVLISLEIKKIVDTNSFEEIKWKTIEKIGARMKSLMKVDE